MNNTVSTNMTQTMESLSQTLVQETYESYGIIFCVANIFGVLTHSLRRLSYILRFGLVGSLALSLYPTILGLSQEIEYIWFKRFSLPALLYIFTRYGALISAGLAIWVGFLPLGSLRTCDNLANVINVITLLKFIGLRGLLIARAYALCKGNKIIAGFLALTFFSGLGLQVYQSITFGGCLTSVTDEMVIVNFLSNIINIISSVIEFIICWWNIWGTWRSKIKAGIRNGNDLVSIFLKQIISGILFGATLSIICAIIQEVFSDDPTSGVLTTFENSLAAILVSDFILDLRQRNSALVEASDVSLPTLQIRSVLQHVHQSFLVEMGDQDENMNLEAVNNDFNDPTRLPGDASHPVEDLDPRCQFGTDRV